MSAQPLRRGAPFPPWPDARLSRVLASAISVLEREQLPTGEMPCYFRVETSGRLEYRRSPLLSCYIHDALAAVDPAAPGMEREVLDALLPEVRGRLVRSAGALRRGIRAFLAWDEHADGSWRFLGRGSGVAADADLTACAAAVLLQARAHGGARRWRRHVDWLAGGPRPHLSRHNGVDGVAEGANVLRFLAVAGEDVEERAAALLAEVLAGGLGRQSPRYPAWIARLYVVVRAWSDGRLPGHEALAAAVGPELLARQQADGSFGTPLDTALALWCLIELDHQGPAVESAAEALLAAQDDDRRWPYDELLSDGGGSVGMTTAAALSALVRAAARAAERES